MHKLQVSGILHCKKANLHALGSELISPHLTSGLEASLSKFWEASSVGVEVVAIRATFASFLRVSGDYVE